MTPGVGRGTARRRLGTSTRFGLVDAAVLLVVLLAAYAVKRHYSTASAEELSWVLGPTAAWVELLTGERFSFEAGVGWVSTDLATAIVPACAGVNFLLIAGVMLVVGFVSRVRGMATKLGWVLSSAVLAFAATLLVNGVRIALGIALREAGDLSPVLSADQVHRVEGVVIYVSALAVLHRWIDVALFRTRARGRGASIVPLGCYLAGTLGVPLGNGAYTAPGFAVHAAAVTLVAVGVAGLFALVRARTGRAAALTTRVEPPRTVAP